MNSDKLNQTLGGRLGKWTRRNRFGVICAVVAIGCFSTLIGIGLNAPTYHDEAVTMLEVAGQAISPWPSGITIVSALKKEKLDSSSPLHRVITELDAYDPHPPLYFSLLWGVAHLTNAVGSLLCYRLVSLILAVAALYVLARWTRSLLCVTLLALSPLEILFATWARDYILAAVLILAVAYLLDLDLGLPRWACYLGGVCGGLAVWAHYLSVFPVGIILLWSLLHRWQTRRSEALWAIVAFMLLSAPVLWHAASIAHSATYTVFPGWSTEAKIVFRSFLNAPMDPFSALPTRVGELASVIFACALLLVLATYRRQPRRVQLALLVVAAQPFVLIFLAGAAHKDFTATRYMGLLLPFYCVLLAMAFGARVSMRPIAALCVVLVLWASSLEASKSMGKNALRTATLGAEGAAGLIIVTKSKSPGAAAAMLNDVSSRMSFSYLQTDEDLQQAMSWNLGAYDRAFLCPPQDTPRTAAYTAFRGHFATAPLRVFSQFDCYAWAGGPAAK